MLGLKTKLFKYTRRSITKKFKGKITNNFVIQELMDTFYADELGHKADFKSANLGYGFIHYSFIRYLRPRSVLCIGSRHGFIPAILAQACKDNKKGKVYFVDAGYGPNDKDHWTGVGFWKTDIGKDIFFRYGLKKYIELFVMTTNEYHKKFPKRNYDYIYIDGDHSYRGVKTDYKLFWPKLTKYGFMVFHDISITKPKPEGTYGVRKFWKEMEKSKSTIVFEYEESGLGIVQKR